MSVTIEKDLEYKAFGDPVLIPVASGATIYGGTLACIDKTGYLQNLSSTYMHNNRVVVIVEDATANTAGPAATTSAGSISGTSEDASADAGDKTCRKVYMNARVKLTFTAIAQSDVGKTVYASDNYTCDETQISGARIGTLVSYISATSGWVMLNTYYNADGTIVARGNLTAATTTAGGDALNWLNPTGETIIIENLIQDITTGATTPTTLDSGIAATGTSNDTLIDGCSTAIGVYSANNAGGTNGAADRKCTSAQYVTITPAGTLAGLVGTYAIKYRLWE